MGLILPFPPQESFDLHRMMEVWTTGKDSPEPEEERHRYGFDTCEGWQRGRDERRILEARHEFWNEEYELRLALPIDLAASPLFMEVVIGLFSSMHRLAVEELEHEHH